MKKALFLFVTLALVSSAAHAQGQGNIWVNNLTNCDVSVSPNINCPSDCSAGFLLVPHTFVVAPTVAGSPYQLPTGMGSGSGGTIGGGCTWEWWFADIAVQCGNGRVGNGANPCPPQAGIPFWYFYGTVKISGCECGYNSNIMLTWYYDPSSQDIIITIQ